MKQENTYKLFKALENSSLTNQRQLAEKLGFSLGKLNYCLKALIDKGLVKAENFCQAKNKKRYVYKLTPAGFKEKKRVTLSFLQEKEQEYKNIKKLIKKLKAELEKINE
jgi:EPS-associated MarR family transcriptional regulator